MKTMYTKKTRKRQRSKSALAMAKRPTFRKPVVAISGGPFYRTGLGNQTWCKMTIARRFQMGGGLAGLATVTQIRTNSINEVYVGLPSQPFTHDQMAQLFERYVVVGCRYKISAFNTSATNAAILALQVCDSSATTTDISTVLGQGQCDWKLVGPTTSGPNIIEFTGYVSNPNVMGVSRENYLNESAYSPAFGANPSDIAFLNIYVADSSGGTAPTLNMLVYLEMNVQLQGLSLIPIS